MRHLVGFAAWGVYAFALVGIWLLGGSPYDGMSALDPTIAVDAIETDGSRSLVRTLLLALSLGAVVLVARTGDTRGRRGTPLVLSMLALLAYGLSRA